MDEITRRLSMGAAGAGEKIYIEDVFSTWLYTGNGSTQTITNGIDLSGKGGMVWVKSRNLTSSHFLQDSATSWNKSRFTNLTNADASVTYVNPLSNGFDWYGATWGDTGYNLASWTFRKAAKFFDVVTFTAGSNTNRRISHSLDSIPGAIILKRTDGTQNWFVYHRSTGRSQYLFINLTSAANSYTNTWGTSDPTSTDFGIDETALLVNGATYVAYLFAHDAGGFGDSGNDSVVSCGSYTGNSSTTGPTISLGWEPQWLLVKAATSAQQWVMIDNMRGVPVGSAARTINPNASDAEQAYTGLNVDFQPTGFQLKTADGWFNLTGVTYIYIAIRRGPMKTPTDATKVFHVNALSASPSTYTTNFPVDSFWNPKRSGSTDNTPIFDRLRGSTASSSKYLATSSTAAEATGTGFGAVLDSNTTVQSSGLWGTNTQVGYCFRRAPGFFDVVAYTGTGSTLNVSHNLGVAPELIIAKNRSSGVTNWAAYSAALGNTQGLYPNAPNAASTLGWWNNTSPTSTVFTVAGTDITVNQSGSGHIAYLFASCSGVSKVGSYTGTGTTIQVNCGFTSGARFVMIKRTDSTGDWYVWDSARGIISGNDPYLLFNSTAAEVTNTDYIDPINAGFEISSTAPAAINANGGSYIFLAIA